MIARFLSAGLLGLVIPSAAAAAVMYRVVPLGDLGGGTSYGTAINDHGTGVGYSSIAGGAQRAFIWTQGGGMQNLGIIGGGDSRAFDVNNADNVVGETSGTAFRWTPGPGMTQLELTLSSANDLNESSEVVGVRTPGGGIERTVRWNSANTATTQFPTSITRGTAINDNNEFVGNNALGSSGYFSFGAGTRTNIGSFIPTDLNNERLIVGSMGGLAASLDFDSNTTTPIGKLAPEHTFSRALGVNEAGTVVGVSETTAFYYDSALGLRNLNTLLRPEDFAWHIAAAEDVNNTGMIIGVGGFNNAADRAVILIPVPEPAALALALVNALACTLLQRSISPRSLTGG